MHAGRQVWIGNLANMIAGVDHADAGTPEVPAQGFSKRAGATAMAGGLLAEPESFGEIGGEIPHL